MRKILIGLMAVLAAVLVVPTAAGASASKALAPSGEAQVYVVHGLPLPDSVTGPGTPVDVYVNGVAEWIPVGRPWILRRKFVEVLARAKPISVQTQHEGIGEGEDGMPNNRIIRNTSSMFPFSVLQDSQRGIEWLNRLMAEG